MSKESILDLTFGAGIDESQRPELMDPRSGFVTRENIRQSAVGGATKRYGYAALGLTRLDGSSRSGGYKHFADGDTINVIDGSALDVYDTKGLKWSSLGRVPEIGYTLSDVPSIASGLLVADVEYCNGYLVMLSESDSGDVYATVLDEATKATVRGPEKINTNGIGVGLTSFSSRYFIAFVGVTDIIAYILDTQAMNTGWATLATVQSAWGTATAATLSVCSLADRAAIAYGMTAGTDRVSVKTYNQTGVLETATVPTSSTTPDSCDIAGSNADTLWIAWNEGTAVKLKGITGNALATPKATTATIITAATGVNQVRISPSTTGKGRMFIRDTNATKQCATRGFQTTTGASATDGAQNTIFNITYASRPFYTGGRHYMALSDGDALQSMCIFADWTNDVAYVRPVANITPFVVTIASFLSKVVAGPTTGQFYYGLLIKRSSVAQTATMVTLDFASPKRWQPVSHGRSLYLTGALTSYTDGSQVSEVGFLLHPRTPTTATSGTGITLTTGRRYVAVYESVDTDGNWVVSGISDPSTSTGAVANKTITITTTTLSLSTRAANASTRIAFYGTVDGAQPPYYRIGTTLNTTAAGTVSTTDTLSDTSMASGAKLYAPNLPGTAGESQDRRAPCGLMYLESYNGMLVGSEGQNIFWSGQPVDGEATWFSPLFQQPYPGCTGLKAQDGVLYAFKRREVSSMVGDAPSDNGQSGGLGLPRRLSGDVGCIDPRSLVATALGIFFQSERGIEIIAAGGQQVTWIGEPVQDTTAAYPICTAATLDASENVVYFEMAATETANQVSGTGRTLVYDLSKRNWTSTDRRKNTAGTADTPAQSACIVYTGSVYRYSWLGTDGRVYVEDRTTHLDPGSTWVTAKAVFPWAHAAGTHGEQTIDRYLFLAESATAHDMTVRLDFDYDTSKTETKLWTAAMLSALTTEWIDKEFERSTSTAVRITLSDATPTSGTVGTGEGATWISLALPGAAHRSVKRTSAAQRGG